MVEELDAGPIVEQEILPTEGLTYHQIRARMLSFQAEIFSPLCRKSSQAGKLPSTYLSQKLGQIWKAVSEEQIRSLERRSNF